MLKILLIQEKSRFPVNIDFRECCCLKRAFEYFNQKVDIWGLGWDNFQTSPDFNNYDLIINMENYGDKWLPDLSKINNPMKMLWTIDSHIRGLKPYLKIFNGGNYDFLLQSTKDFVQLDPNKKSIWFPNAVDDFLFTPSDWYKKKFFIGFCGSLLNRRPYLKRLDKWFENEYKENIRLLGPDMVSAIQDCKINFNLNISNDINFRSFETLGAGAVLCTNYNHQYSELGFEDNKNCIFFDYKTDILSKYFENFKRLHKVLSYYYENQDQLEKIARNGIIFSQKHTYKERAKLLLRIIETGKIQGFGTI